MWQHLFFVSVLVAAVAIKVPVENKEDDTETSEQEQSPVKPIYYASDDANVDSYLVPPDPHKPEQVLPDISETPATYLLPPSPEKQTNYYTTTESDGESDWYPIAQTLPQNQPVHVIQQRQPDSIPIFVSNNNNQSEIYEILENPRGGRVLEESKIIIAIPSSRLEPPLENAPNDYAISAPSEELELPAEKINQQFDVPLSTNYELPILKTNPNPLVTKNVPLNFRLKAAEPTLALHLTPPIPNPPLSKFKNPTKLYPKKYAGGFKPIPIPIAQFAEDTFLEVPRAKPVKPFKPSAEGEYLMPSDEKKIYLYEQAEHKRKLKEADATKQQQLEASTEELYDEVGPTEQEASETNYRHNGRNAYPVPLKQEPPTKPSNDAYAAPPPGERTEFRMHGMKGPHSYQFGYDTGKGKNRQFRYEERDNDGHVRGHYGYMDKRGKLRVVNYDAHPEFGFRAEAPIEKE